MFLSQLLSYYQALYLRMITIIIRVTQQLIGNIYEFFQQGYPARRFSDAHTR